MGLSRQQFVDNLPNWPDKYFKDFKVLMGILNNRAETTADNYEAAIINFVYLTSEARKQTYLIMTQERESLFFIKFGFFLN